MEEDRGKVTVGVTDQGAQHLAALMETGWFGSEMAAYLLAISTALARELVTDPTPLAGVTTKWNVGSLDRDGRLRDLVRLTGPEDVRDPYEYAERLADTGLEYLRDRVVNQGSMLSDVLDPQPVATSASAAEDEEISGSD